MLLQFADDVHMTSKNILIYQLISLNIVIDTELTVLGDLKPSKIKL